MNAEQIMEQVVKGKITSEEGLKLIEESKNPIRFKVSEKGAVSVYGLQRFPVTLYINQWERILNKSEELKDFLQKNEQNLVKKS